MREKVAEAWIADSGPGFAVGKLKHVFEPFFTTKENGMGLSIARGMGQDLGGE